MVTDVQDVAVSVSASQFNPTSSKVSSSPTKGRIAEGKIKHPSKSTLANFKLVHNISSLRSMSAENPGLAPLIQR